MSIKIEYCVSCHGNFLNLYKIMCLRDYLVKKGYITGLIKIKSNECKESHALNITNLRTNEILSGEIISNDEKWLKRKVFEDILSNDDIFKLIDEKEIIIENKNWLKRRIADVYYERLYELLDQQEKERNNQDKGVKRRKIIDKIENLVIEYHDLTKK